MIISRFRNLLCSFSFMAEEKNNFVCTFSACENAIEFCMIFGQWKCQSSHTSTRFSVSHFDFLLQKPMRSPIIIEENWKLNIVRSYRWFALWSHRAPNFHKRKWFRFFRPRANERQTQVQTHTHAQSKRWGSISCVLKSKQLIKSILFESTGHLWMFVKPTSFSVNREKAKNEEENRQFWGFHAMHELRLPSLS